MNSYQIREGFNNIDIVAIHDFLTNNSYWAKGIPMATVERSLKNSFCVGVFDNKAQIALARFVTDYATLI